MRFGYGEGFRTVLARSLRHLMIFIFKMKTKVSPDSQFVNTVNISKEKNSIQFELNLNFDKFEQQK